MGGRRQRCEFCKSGGCVQSLPSLLNLLLLSLPQSLAMVPRAPQRGNGPTHSPCHLRTWPPRSGPHHKLLGRVFKCLSKLVGSAFYLPPTPVPVVASALLYVGVSSYQELTQKGFPDQSSTAVREYDSTLRLPAILTLNDFLVMPSRRRTSVQTHKNN